MFVTFIVAKGGANPTVDTITGSTTPPAEFPSMTDDAYNKAFKSLGNQGKLYCVGIPVVPDDPELLDLGELVFVGFDINADVAVPLHTCTAYRWFDDQSPTGVNTIETPQGTVYTGDVPGGTIILAPVVMV